MRRTFKQVEQAIFTLWSITVIAPVFVCKYCPLCCAAPFYLHDFRVTHAIERLRQFYYHYQRAHTLIRRFHFGAGTMSSLYETRRYYLFQIGVLGSPCAITKKKDSSHAHEPCCCPVLLLPVLSLPPEQWIRGSTGCQTNLL